MCFLRGKCFVKVLWLSLMGFLIILLIFNVYGLVWNLVVFLVGVFLDVLNL